MIATLHDAAELECQLTEANGFLAESSEMPPGVVEFVERLAQSLAEGAAWLDKNTGVSQRRLADLLGVGKRTLQRWVAGTSSPSEDYERRLRIVARLVNHLR